MITFYLLSYILAYASVTALAVSLAATVLLIATAVFLAIKKKRTDAFCLSLIAVTVIAASLLSYFVIHTKKNATDFDGTSLHTVQCEIMNENSVSEYFSVYTVHITDIDGRTADHRAVLEISGTNLNTSNMLTYIGTIDEICDAVPSDEIGYYLPDGIFHYSVLDRIIDESYREPSSLTEYAKVTNAHLSAMLINEMGRDAGGFASALFLGNKSFLARGTQYDFSRLGVSHLLSISGLHLTLLAYSVKKFIDKLTGNRFASNITCIAVAAAYTVLTGFPLSLCRAAIMITVSAIAAMISKNADMLTSLGISAALIVSVNPYASADISLLLSFLAMLGCIAYQSIIKQFTFEKIKVKPIRKAVSYICSSLLMSVLAVVFTFPAVYLSFDEFSVVSPIANLLYIPLTSVALVLTLVMLLLSPIPLLFEAVGAVLSAFIGFTTDSAEYFASFSGITVSTHYDGFVIILILSAVLIVALRKRRIAVKLAAGAVCIAVCVAYVLVSKAISFGNNEIYAATASKNDAVIVSSENRVMIIDISDGSYGIAGEATDTLQKETHCEIDTYLLTHYHVRHAATLEKLSDRILIRGIILPLPISESDFEAFDKICSVAEDRGISIAAFDRSAEYSQDFYGTEITLAPYIKLTRSTHPVIVFSIEADGERITYLGSAHNDDDCADTVIPHLDSDAVILGIHGPVNKISVQREDYITESLFYSSKLTELDSYSYFPHRRDTVFAEGKYAKVK